MLSDIEIAQQANLLPIKEVAAQIGITEDELAKLREVLDLAEFYT